MKKDDASAHDMRFVPWLFWLLESMRGTPTRNTELLIQPKINMQNSVIRNALTRAVGVLGRDHLQFE
jgi:hypothetical protein